MLLRCGARPSSRLAVSVIVCVGIVLLLYSVPSSVHEELAKWKPASGSRLGLIPIAPHPDQALKYSSDTEAIHNISAIHTTIKELWKSDWAPAYVNAQPMSSPILLTRHHRNVMIYSNHTESRKPAKSLVRNPKSDIDELQKAHAAFLSSLPSMKPADYRGRGVVILGGGEYIGPAIVALHMLRKTGSTLPVEVFLADESEYEKELCDHYLPHLNAQCVVIADIYAPEETNTPPIAQYQLKSLAILFSSFAEVLYLDSDSLLLINPDKDLFDVEPFKSTGFVIWPDFWQGSESPLFYTIAGLSSFPPTLPLRSSESGQLLFDKKRHLKSLLLATYYNIYGPEYYYPLLSQGTAGEGDKETYLAAAVVLDMPYYRVKTPVEIVHRDAMDERGTGMIQYHPVDDMNAFKSWEAAEVVGRVRPFTAHLNLPKPNAGQLVGGYDLFGPDGKRLRLWGKKEKQIENFGKDLEREVWQILVKTGCELADVVKEWKHRPGLCQRLHKHWNALYALAGQEA